MTLIGNIIRTGVALLMGAYALGLTACQAPEEEAGSSPAFRGAHSTRILSDDAAGYDWAAYGRTYGEQHFSPLDEINTETVKRLDLAWYYDLPMGNAPSGPIAVDGVLYTATEYSVVRAFKAADGELLWTFDPEVVESAGRKLRLGWGIRGLAWWNDRIYVGTHDGRLIAIDASTGQPVWSRLTFPEFELRYISGAPRVFDGKVIIGNAGADNSPIRGYVTAYEAETGTQLWRFFVVPGDPAKGFENAAMRTAAKTWSGEWWRYGGGGTVWNAITYDQDFDTIYIGTGNGFPWNHRIRSEGKGDNLFLCSVVALDADTGTYKWHYQFNPGETWDYNAAMDMQLTSLRSGGEIKKVLVTAPKNGFIYTIARANGELVSAEPIAKVTWASEINLRTGRPVEHPDARFPNGTRFLLQPSPVGAHSWPPMALDPRRNIVFIPKIEMSVTFDDIGIDAATWQPSGGGAKGAGLNVGSGSSRVPWSDLLAWDIEARHKLWSVPTPGVINGGVMATAGNLVFQGRADGKFVAYSMESGEALWIFDAQVGIVGPPISYLAGDRQYVTVIAGFGTTAALLGPLSAQFGWDYRSQQRRILTFALHGKAELPAPAPKYVLAPVEDVGYAPDPALEQVGSTVYDERCFQCHGVAVVAGGLAPDVRASPALLSQPAFDAIVRQGALVAHGMPKFEELSQQEVNGLRQFLRSQAKAALQSEAAVAE